MNTNSSLGKKSVVENIITVILCLLTAITLAVLLITFINSFKNSSELIKNMFGFPRTFTFDGYKTIFTEDHFGRYFLNSLILTIGGVALLILVSSMAAYGLARYHFKGNEVLRGYFMAGMMFPATLGVLPLFLILRSLGLLNTLRGMIILYGAGVSAPILIFRNFFTQIPVSLEESAKLDGANDFITYLFIILPISKPVIFTVALLNSVTIWNDFYMPMVFLTRPNVRTLTLGIRRYMEDFLRHWDVAFSAVVISLIPVLILYFLFSNQLVSGLTGGAIKE